MDERSFETLLCRALMEASLADFRDVPESGGEPAFSAGYRRQRIRLLADPFRWARKRARPMWRRALQSAACVLLTCAVVLGGLMAVSPTVRAAVLGWLREITNGSITYIGPEGRDPKVYNETPSWRPTWLPEGWRLDAVRTIGEGEEDTPGGWVSQWAYRKGEEILELDCTHSTAAKVGMSLGAGSEASYAYEPAEVWGRSADFYIDRDDENGDGCLVWTGADGELFQLSGPLDKETLEQIAGSVTEVEAEPLPVYRLGWLPEGSGEPYARSTLREAVHEQFNLADGTICNWTYAAESVCPLAKPKGTPEVVDIRGVKGRFWGPKDPESGGITITVGSSRQESDPQVYILPDADQESTLLWTDPDTGISFRIQGRLEKEDLLRIAEEIQLDEAEKAEKN